MMYNDHIKENNEVILPTNDLNFKRLFASPNLIHISKGFLQDLAAYDPLELLQISSLSIETPYNFQEVNQLNADHKQALLNTEVDYACCDENGVRFLLEMQKRKQTYLEERVAYNIGQKFAQSYAGNDKNSHSKYASLQPVIAVIILDENYFKEDDIAIRFLRPNDTRYGVYKKNLNLGLEIYVEINKDISQLPENLQLWMEYFRTGRTPEEAPCYLQEAARMTKTISFTKEERKLADLIEKAEQKRILEDEAVRLDAEATAEAKVAIKLAQAAETMTQAEKTMTQAEETMTQAEETMTQAEETMTQAEETMTQAKAAMVQIETRIAHAVKDEIEQERKKADAEKIEEKLEIAQSLLQTNMSVDDVAKCLTLPVGKVKALIV